MQSFTVYLTNLLMREPDLQPSTEPCKPLCVDLDGTLIHTDCLFETLIGAIRLNPFVLFQVIGWLMKGRPILKAELAKRFLPDPALLPWNESVLEYVKKEKTNGRKTLLVTASDHRVAKSIGDYTGLFDEVAASDGRKNLKSHRKAKHLEERFGEKGFDYIGNEGCDLAIWKVAGKALLANEDGRLENRARTEGLQTESIGPARPALTNAILKACRPHQWAKNLLLFLPILTAHLYLQGELLAKAGIAFVAMGLCASVVYLMNDLLDLESDRVHESKKKRPFASGNLPLHVGLFLLPILFLGSFGLAVGLVNLTFALMLGGYFVSTCAYSFHLKQRILVDVFMLSGLYSLRIWMGATIACEPGEKIGQGAIEISHWLITFSSLIFLSLAMAKRYSELHNLSLRKINQTSGRSYRVDDMHLIAQFGTISGYLAALVLALYVSSEKSISLYSRPAVLWMICPLLLYWISRVWLITCRGKMREDPVVFAVRDKISYIVGALILLAPFLADPK